VKSTPRTYRKATEQQRPKYSKVSDICVICGRTTTSGLRSLWEQGGGYVHATGRCDNVRRAGQLPMPDVRPHGDRIGEQFAAKGGEA
jgi:hypothetical protein